MKTSKQTANLDLKRPMLVSWLAFILLFGVAGGWMANAKISSAVIANGLIVVQGKAKSIQHPDGGVIKDILVEDGQVVRKDDPVLVLDADALTANLKILGARLQQLTAERARLLAERESASAIRFDYALLQKLGIKPTKSIEVGQQDLFKIRQLSRDGEERQLENKILQVKDQIAAFKATQETAAKQMIMMQEGFSNLTYLHAKGHATDGSLRTMKLGLSEMEKQQNVTAAKLDEAHNLIGELEIRRMQNKRNFANEVIAQLASGEQEIHKTAQQIRVTKSMLKRTVLKAPIGGMVHELQATTIGGVIKAGEIILQIVPQNQPIEIDAMIDPRFIDQMHIGQLTNIRMTALNLRETPEIEGYVTKLSPMLVQSDEYTPAHYRAKVSISSQQLDRLGDVKLVPGMPVEIFAQTGDRTPLAYLSDPLVNQFSRALKEE